MSFKLKEPRKALKFEIQQKHCEIAKRNNACQCVIAQAFIDKYGNLLLEIQVLSTITVLIWSGGHAERYQTPPKLRVALREFDKTGKWDLPHGQYSLLPIPPSQTAKAQKIRAIIRRYKDDSNMSRKYPFSGKLRQRAMNPRFVNLKALRDTI